MLRIVRQAENGLYVFGLFKGKREDGNTRYIAGVLLDTALEEEIGYAKPYGFHLVINFFGRFFSIDLSIRTIGRNE